MNYATDVDAAIVFATAFTIARLSSCCIGMVTTNITRGLEETAAVNGAVWGRDENFRGTAKQAYACWLESME